MAIDKKYYTVTDKEGLFRDLGLLGRENESKVSEQEESKVKIVAKKIENKEVADTIARGISDSSVVTDDEDEKKFMVVVRTD